MNDFNSLDSLTVLLFSGFLLTSILMLCALIMKRTNGLFLSRTPNQFKLDRNNPDYEKERQWGQRMATFIFTYISPIFIGFLVFFVLKLMHII